MNRSILNHQRCIWLAVLIMALQSCTKTEYTDYEKEPLNHILEYRVINTQQELLGAIDNDNNIITVYIPYYAGAEYLNVEIKLDEGAKLLDSTGAEINLDGGPDPVRVGSNPIKYTVVPQTGDQRTYTLIQKILPHGDPLHATYADLLQGETVLNMRANMQLKILGNFESTSTNARFFLTDKATGKVYDNFIQGIFITPGNESYAFMTYISPDALAGEYDVRMEHQGRSTTLPGLKLDYQKPRAGTFTSTATYAEGDTITFNINTNNTTRINATVFQKVERAYIKIRRAGSFPAGTRFIVPNTFPESLYDTEIEMKIVSQNRTQLKAIFPKLPAGQYLNNIYTAANDLEQGLSWYTDANFGFYADFAEETGWGKGHLFGSVSVLRFTVKEKSN